MTGTGTFRPLPGAAPVVGQVGRVEQVAETRLEMVLPRSLRAAVLAALRAAHPYEEPAFSLVEHVAVAGPGGLGRVGLLPEPLRLADLVVLAARVLPSTAAGVRAAGDPDLLVRTAGGERRGRGQPAGRGGGEPGRRRSSPLTFATTRRASASTPGGLALLDAAHWATEWPWLGQAADLLRADLRETPGGAGRYGGDRRLDQGHRPLDAARGLRVGPTPVPRSAPAP